MSRDKFRGFIASFIRFIAMLQQLIQLSMNGRLAQALGGIIICAESIDFGKIT